MAINAWQARQSRHFFQRSVIPCNADKSPRVQWTSLQSSLISDAQIELSFAQPAPAIAVITGGPLLCIDIDAPDVAAIFQRDFPDLWNTTRNRTARGYHLFYNVTTDDNLTNKRAAGVDFLHEGCYALLPPSPGKYPDQAGPLRPLAAADYDRLIAAFAPLSDSCRSGVSHFPESIQPQLTPALNLVGLYHERRQVLGSRNAALYRAASYARSAGLSQSAVEAALLDHFVNSPAPRGHRRESVIARGREGRATIASAYKGKPYAIKRLVESLPAAAHQAMSQKKHTAAARALDKLYKLRRRQVTQADLQDLDTDWGMRRLVAFLAASGLVEIGIIPPNPPQRRYAGYPSDTPTEKQIVFAQGHNQQKPPDTGGRPRYLYSIPSCQAVCDWLGVQHWWIDPIDLDALDSKTPLRLALLRGLLLRLGAQGRSSLSWQATVFGVCKKTIIRWHKRLGVISQHPGRILSGANLRRYFPDQARQDDCWIQDRNGKRYPAKQVIAAQLWSQGKTGLTYHRRSDPNRYYLPDNAPRQSLPYDEPTEPTKTPEWRSQIDPEQFTPPVSWKPAPDSTVGVSERPNRTERLYNQARLQYGLNWRFSGPDESPGPAAYVPKWGALVPGTPLADEQLEDSAVLLYNELNRRARPDQRIRADTMRRLVSQYGPDRVRSVVKRTTGRIHNPVGYLIGCLAKEETS